MDDPSTTDTTEGFGLIFYNARFYSPCIMQFIQPDTIIPQPANPQSWNRYSYVQNNPIRYNDPTGHMISDDEDGGLTADGFKFVIEKKYKWKLKDKFSLDEVKIIYQAAHDIETYVDGLTNGNGLEWMQEYLGNTSLTHGDNTDEYSETWPFLSGPKIWLGQGWLSDGGWDSKQLLTHELGHVWDIRMGMNASVQLYEDMGGQGFSWPFRKPSRNIPLWDTSVNPYGKDAYGNTGINDYFAEAFSWTIYNGITPQGVPDWINTTIMDRASNIR